MTKYEYKAREGVKQDFSAFLGKGYIPLITIETEELGEISIEIFLDSFGVGFTYTFQDTDEYDNFKPYFDGAIQKRNGAYYVSFAEIDRMEYKLDVVLQLINDNVYDGVVCAIGR